jgi:hypothetical protein
MRNITLSVAATCISHANLGQPSSA